jgi:DNA-binding transcriptional LysR family regulator
LRPCCGLSAAGEALYDSAVTIESKVQKMYSGAYEDQLAGPLRVTQPQVGFVDTYGICAAFIRRHPEINLEILPIYWEVNLNTQEADVAILAGKHPHELLVGQQLGSVRWHIYASKNYLAGFSEPPTPEDLDWVMLQRELLNIAGAGIVNLRDLLLEEVANPKVVMQSRSYSDVMFAV